MTNKFSKAPQKELKNADSFIQGAATEVHVQNTDVKSFPWDGKRDDKQTEAFNIRFTEVELEKLRFIGANTPLSQHAFCRQVLIPAIEMKIRELIGEK